MHILIKDFNGFSTSIEIEPTSIVEKIKEKIEECFWIPKEGQSIKLNDIELDDNKIINQYDIKEGTILELILKDNYIKINAINIMGKILTFYCKISDKIKDIKIKINNREGIPVAFQKLIFDSKEKKIVLEDDKSIDDYKIKMNDRIHILYNNL